jgi:two-component system KDP operon response regulator KdpE
MKLLETEDNSDLQPFILVVVNDSELRRHIRNALDKQGYLVMTAGSAIDALKLTSTAKPQMVLLDMELPGCDSVNLISDLRNCASTSVIALSTNITLAEEITALDSGADDYLNIPTKPFCFKKLLARIRVQLRRPTPEKTSNLVEFGNISIDLNRRHVTRKGEKVHLTPTEFRLVRTLLFNPGKVLTSKYLLREVWGAEKSDRFHYLRTYVVRLRNKLEEDPVQPKHILTETGMGYCLVV